MVYAKSNFSLALFFLSDVSKQTLVLFSLAARKRICVVATTFSFHWNFNYCHYVITYYQICARIKSAREREAKFESLFVMKDSSSTESENELFVDTAVYSRNRCFRIALSSKAGKKSFLLPSERFKCKGMVWFSST